jgi:hypothetical protein
MVPRWIGAFLALLAAGSGTWWIHRGMGLRARVLTDFESAAREPIATFDWNLSRSGAHEAVVEPWYQPGHGLMVLVADPTRGDRAPNLAGLVGEASIEWATSGSFEQVALGEPPMGWHSAIAPHAWAIASLNDYQIGRHRIRLAISQGATEAGSHRVLVYTRVCGCETFMARLIEATMLVVVPATVGAWGLLMSMGLCRSRP